MQTPEEPSRVELMSRISKMGQSMLPRTAAEEKVRPAHTHTHARTHTHIHTHFCMWLPSTWLLSGEDGGDDACSRRRWAVWDASWTDGLPTGRLQPHDARGKSPDDARGESPNDARGKSPDDARGQSSDDARGQSSDDARGESPNDAGWESTDDAIITDADWDSRWSAVVMATTTTTCITGEECSLGV